MPFHPFETTVSCELFLMHPAELLPHHICTWGQTYSVSKTLCTLWNSVWWEKSNYALILKSLCLICAKNGTPTSLTAIITSVTQYHNIKSYFQIGTGFSDEALQKHTTFFKQHVIPQPRPYFRYDSQHEPDHWFDAVQVWEIKCADLSLSPVHRAAIGIVSMMSSYTCVCSNTCSSLIICISSNNW